MSKKEYFLVGLVVVLGGLYALYFTDWFGHKVIRIEHTVRSLRDAWGPGGRRADPTGKQVNNVTFALHKDYKLTSIKVIVAADGQTNKFAHALWHLVAPKGSPPVNSLSYGMPVDGMVPSIPGIEAEPLEPGVEYRLVVEASKVKGEHNFQIAGPGR